MFKTFGGMMGFRKALGGPPSKLSLPEKLVSASDIDVDSELYNRLHELQLLVGHTDIVRVLVKVDERRLASASDDKTIIIWDTLRGKPLHVLRGHTQTVTCLLLVPLPASAGGPVLVSGSADKTIRIWDISQGVEITEKPLTQHTGAVKCLVLLDANSGSFCSGASDNQLVVWCARNGSMNGVIYRSDDLIYDLESLTLHKTLSSPTEKAHREAVCCLAATPSGLLASASLDGEIKLWSMKTLNCVKSLNYGQEYRDTDHRFTFAVQHLLPIDDRYLLSAVGVGFSLWDVITGECLVNCAKAHRAAVEHVITLYNNERIVTCSADSSLRIWGPDLASVLQLGAPAAGSALGRRLTVQGSASTSSSNASLASTASSSSSQPLPNGPRGIELFLAGIRRTQTASERATVGGGGTSQYSTPTTTPVSPYPATPTSTTTANPPMPASPSKENATSTAGTSGGNGNTAGLVVCVADLLAHAGAVKVAVALNESSFAAAGSDGLITLWKDAYVENQKRNEALHSLMSRYIPAEEDLLY